MLWRKNRYIGIIVAIICKKTDFPANLPPLPLAVIMNNIMAWSTIELSSILSNTSCNIRLEGFHQTVIVTGSKLIPVLRKILFSGQPNLYLKIDPFSSANLKLFTREFIFHNASSFARRRLLNWISIRLKDYRNS